MNLTPNPNASTVAYDAFALSYSQTMAEDFCRRLLPAYCRLLSGRPSSGHLLDICCGSGQWAREFTQSGYEVTGLDASREMLELARHAAPEAHFVVADVRDFHFKTYFSGAVSAFNSLAHASSHQELLSIVRNVRQVLAPGAPFVFDLSMEEAYVSRWHGKLFFNSNTLAFVVEPTYDAGTRTACNQIRITQRDCGLLSNSAFTITQHCYSEEEVHRAARLAGFDHVESFDAEDDLGIAGERGRMLFRCR